MNIKEIKSLDLSSYTIITTGISVLFSILISVILAIVIGIFVPQGVTFSIYIVPTIIVATLMYTIYNSFCGGFLFNVFASKLNRIKLTFNGGEISAISTTETAIIISMIATIQVILIYLVSVLLLPLMINSAIQTFMFAGQQGLAYSLYQFLTLISQPMTIILIIVGTFIITFAYVLLGTYIYNILGNQGRGIVLNLSSENNYIAIDSIETIKFAVVFTIIAGILTIITNILLAVNAGFTSAIIINIIIGFVGGFIQGALIAVFYNFLSSKLGKLKIELIDQ